MIAVDTNILVYAHRKDSPWHEQARGRVVELAEGRAPWAVPWPCLHEFLAIVTHPRIFKKPTPVAAARDQVDAWLESPALVLLAETAGYWRALRELVASAQVSGPQVHDARIAALCLHHGVAALWTADRDFSRFPELPASNPLIA
ncbi:MAG TPA: TA system VapC family ribonuclease toxin [Vicinamibacteria bacterium]|nr:TA system VapC family ribonuclease toxin [Vicinamibacteria bacterium]